MTRVNNIALSRRRKNKRKKNTSGLILWAVLTPTIQKEQKLMMRYSLTLLFLIVSKLNKIINNVADRTILETNLH